eukprot:COSAG01_NODE_10000_length_2278_cov_4.358880_3_plen_141_part_00
MCSTGESSWSAAAWLVGALGPRAAKGAERPAAAVVNLRETVNLPFSEYNSCDQLDDYRYGIDASRVTGVTPGIEGWSAAHGSGDLMHYSSRAAQIHAWLKAHPVAEGQSRECARVTANIDAVFVMLLSRIVIDTKEFAGL